MPAMLEPIRNAWTRYCSLRGVPRELVTLGLCLAVALFILPLIIWAAGQAFLGEYVRDPSGTPTGGPLALWIDFLRGLAQGSLGYWLALLGPWLIVLALRGSRWFLRV
jgi:hypothetical protein